ncbi:hypothetical protein YDYSY3_36970 [Paenibacillus chitinolyticus]|uniref:DUF6137 domain-containing protein n=1 Tax=Paenibacillus chitinolyticus TaxID=79263 RepID=UPI0026E4DE83|nr:DUF6137 domain-containing protein [Paenibacillus chitinolyticus]GKS12697.1 hypothetical protein YDYSY3_36970 [Paenibacillus chitinolyticus]
MENKERNTLYQVIYAISGVTGEDGDELVETFKEGPLEVDKRDFFEIVQRVESLFDCTLDMNLEGPYLIHADEIVTKITKLNV